MHFYIQTQIGEDIYMNAVAVQETFNQYTIGNSLRNLRENRKKTQINRLKRMAPLC